MEVPQSEVTVINIMTCSWFKGELLQFRFIVVGFMYVVMYAEMHYTQKHICICKCVSVQKYLIIYL